MNASSRQSGNRVDLVESEQAAADTQGHWANIRPVRTVHDERDRE